MECPCVVRLLRKNQMYASLIEIFVNGSNTSGIQQFDF